MTWRRTVAEAGAVFLVALVARALYASAVPFPQPEDTAYYVSVARNLVEGHGLVSDAIWSYQTPPLVFPRPAFEVWLPLPTFLAAIPMAILGTSFSAAQVSSVLIGSLVPVLAWRIAGDVAAERQLSSERSTVLAMGAGLTSAVALPVLLHAALPDSTMPFAVLALTACWLMARVARDPAAADPRDPRVIALGIVIGLAALTRNDAIWLGVVWAWTAWRLPELSRAQRARMIVVAGAIAIVIFAPWAWRDWTVFGSPFPGQAAANALSISGFDIFAWNDPPTLARYLAVGPERLAAMRVDGLSHNLISVLLLPGLPISLVGLLALPWQGRDRTLRPLLLASLAIFLFTSLVFPVATTWGTFLHAAGPVHILLIVSALLALDAGIARLAAWRGWTKPVAWLGAVAGVGASVAFSLLLLPGFAEGATDRQVQYATLASRMAAAGHPLDASAGPVITDFPIWLADTQRIPTLALPDESPASILSLARDPRFAGTHLLVVMDPEHGRWPAVLDGPDPDAACFREIPLAGSAAVAAPAPAPATDPLAGVRAFEIVCP